MNISLSAISDYALPWIKSGQASRFHSRYAKTLNLVVGQQLVGLQPQQAYLTPLSLLTDYDEKAFSQFIQQFDEEEKGDLNIQFDLRHCQVFPSQLTPQMFGFIHCCSYAEQAEQLLRQSDKNGLRPLLIENKAEDFLFEAFGQILCQVNMAAEQGDYQQAAQKLASLVGLGIGLTPSGDDFLCGVLAACHKISLKKTAVLTLFIEQLSLNIEQNLDKTNEISRAFLHCALQNHFSQPIRSFFAESPLEQGLSILQQFENIGHSSGIDTLCGIYFAMNLFTKNLVENE